MYTANEFSFETILLLKEVIKRDPQSQLLATFKQVFNDVKDILGNRIPKVFDQYTIHDIGHSVRIMDYMYYLIEDITILDELEIIILCYAALLHDVGMAVTDEEINLIKKDLYKVNDYKYSAFLKLHGGNTYTALREFVRKFHAKRSADFIENNLKDLLHIPNHYNYSFWKELGLICQSHNESFDWVNNYLSTFEVRGTQSFNPQYCACLLRLADILDFDDQRTPYKLYEFIKPTGFSLEEWKQHYSIHNYNKISIDEWSNNKRISFIGQCNNPRIHRKLLSYFDWVGFELRESIKLTRLMKKKYQLNFVEQIGISIKAEGYSFSEHKMEVDFRAVTTLLTGEQIYGDKRYGLRELLQNSIDACKVRIEETKSNEDDNEYYKPTINVIINKKKNTIIIKDNGIGMTFDTIKKHFLNVGSSYYKSSEFKLKDYNFNPIGNFGIGFLACFMLSSTVKIITRHITSQNKYIIDIERYSEHTSVSVYNDLLFFGTEIILNYDSFFSAFDEKIEEIISFIKFNFIVDEIAILIVNSEFNSKLNIYNNLFDLDSIDDSYLKHIYLKNSNTPMKGTVGYWQYQNRLMYNLNEILISDEDIPFKSKIENLYYLNELNNLEVVNKDTADITKYISNNELFYLCFPMLTKEQEENLEKYLVVRKKNFNNLDDFIRIFNPKFSIIIMSKNTLKNIFKISLNNFSGKSLSRFIKVDWSFNANLTRSFKKIVPNHKFFTSHKQLIYKANSKNTYVRFLEFNNNYSKFSPFKSIYGKSIYLNNVLISKAQFSVKYIPFFYEINTYKVNIVDMNLYPTVSRTQFDNIADKYLNINYHKKIHNLIISELEIDSEEKNVLLEFINFSFLNSYSSH